MGDEESVQDEQENHTEQENSNLEDLFDLTENTRGFTENNNIINKRGSKKNNQ